MTLRKTDGTCIGVDPFNYLPISGVAFNGIYLQHFLPPQMIAVVPRPPKSNDSIKQNLWMEWEMNGTNTFFQHALNGGEVSIDLLNGKKVTIDGYVQQLIVCMNFMCYYHGCPAHYESSAPTPHQVGKTMYQKGDTVYERLKFGNLLSNTITRMENIKEAAFNVVEKWECKWDNICKEFLLPISKNELEHIKYLIPRDAYFSARTNAVKLHYRCDGAEAIHYLDVTTRTFFFPAHHPFILKAGNHQFPPLNDIFGLIHSCTTPPDDLYFPVLPERTANGKLLFHLNEMAGTWISAEVQKAVQLCYVIQEIYKVHHFETECNALFKAYNETFFLYQTCCKTSW